MPRSHLRALLVVGIIVLSAPLGAHATMYAPGETLNPDCGPLDPDCGVLTTVGAGTANQVPFYAADGNVLSATSTLQVLSTGQVSTADLLPQTAGASSAGVVKEIIDGSIDGYAYGGLGLALGSDGFARIAYGSDNSPYPISFARCTDADCSSPVITTAVAATQGVTPGSQIMTLGADGFARFTYMDSDGALQFVRCLDEDCSTKNTNPIDSNTADEPGYYGTSIEMGSDGFPRIVYANASGDTDIHYVRCTDADCTSPVDTDSTAFTGDAGDNQVSMTIGPDHFARFTYMDNDDLLKLSRCTDADCTAPVITTVDATPSANYYGSIIRIGSDGFPRIAYLDAINSPYPLRYAVCTDADCTSPTITEVADTDGETFNGFGFDLRSGDLASITYEAADDSGHVINCTNAACTTSDDVALDSQALAFYGSAALVIGPDNLPRVAYVDDGTDESLHYARLGTLDGVDATSGTSIGTESNNFNTIYAQTVEAAHYLLNGSPLPMTQWTSSSTDIYYTAGNVGIGTTSPAYRLDVAGDINLTGTLYQNGSPVSLSGGSAITLPRTSSDSSGVLTLGSTIFLSDYSVGSGCGSIDSDNDGSNAFIGGAGNFSLIGGAGCWFSNYNTGVGTKALSSLTSGFSNTGLGQHSLHLDTTGYSNTAIGVEAFSSLTTGRENTLLGSYAGATNITGIGDTILGMGSDVGSDGLTNATAIGYHAVVGASNALILGGTGSYAVNVGIGTINPGTTFEVAGTERLTSTDAGGVSSDVLIYRRSLGQSVGSYANIASFNTPNGAFHFEVDLSDNGAGESHAKKYIITGNFGDAYNSGWYQVLPVSDSGPRGGDYALDFGGNGAVPGSVMALRLRTTSTLSAGSTAIDIKITTLNTPLVAALSDTGTGATVAGLFSQTRLTQVAGLVGIGTSTPATALEVGGDITDDNVLNCSTLKTDTNGKINCVSSDERLKDEITPLDATSSLSAIEALNPVSFFWRDPTNGSEQQLGFIAQDVQQIFPQLISTTSPTALTPDGTLTFNYLGLISPMVKAIQELAGQVSDLVATVTSFGNKFTTNELCVGSTCVDEDQLKALLNNEGVAPSSGSADPVTPSDSDTTSTAATSTPDDAVASTTPDAVASSTPPTDTPPSTDATPTNPSTTTPDASATLPSTDTGETN